MTGRPYAELHCHTNFSFLDGASPPDELVERAVELGLSGLAVTDHSGLYGVVRFATAAQEAGLRPVDRDRDRAARRGGPDPDGLVIPPRRPAPRGAERPDAPWTASDARPCPRDGAPGPAAPGPRPSPRPSRPRQGGSARDRGRQRGPHLVLLARDAAGYRSLCRLVSRANLAGTKSMPALHPGAPRRARGGARGAVGLPRGRDRPAAAGRGPGGGAGAAERYAPGASRGPGRARRRVRGIAGRRLLPGAAAPPAPRRRLARGGDRAPGRRSWACRSWSRTTSTTPTRRTASSTTS